MKKTAECWPRCAFPEGEGGAAAITRTFVDEALRGQGMAGQLMQRAAEHLRASGRKAVPVCSYAAAWFKKHPNMRTCWRKLKIHSQAPGFAGHE